MALDILVHIKQCYSVKILVHASACKTFRLSFDLRSGDSGITEKWLYYGCDNVMFFKHLFSGNKLPRFLSFKGA